MDKQLDSDLIVRAGTCLARAASRASTVGIELIIEVVIHFILENSGNNDGGSTDIEGLAIDLVRAHQRLSPPLVVQSLDAGTKDVLTESGPSLSGHAHRAGFTGGVERKLTPEASVERVVGEQGGAISDGVHFAVIRGIGGAASSEAAANQFVAAGVDNDGAESIEGAFRSVGSQLGVESKLHPVFSNGGFDTIDGMVIRESEVVLRVRDAVLFGVFGASEHGNSTESKKADGADEFHFSVVWLRAVCC